MKIHTTGDTTSKTITDTITDHTASAAHGTGAGITTHGTHGISPHGDITAGTTHGIMGQTGAGMTLGTTEDTGDGTIHGITADTGEADGTMPDIIRTTDGTTRSGAATITTMAQAISLTITRMCGMDRDIRQVRTGSSQARHPSGEALAAEAQSAETHRPDAQLRQFPETHLREAHQ